MKDKITPHNIQLFKTHAKHYRKLFGLKNWEIECKLDPENSDENYAYIEWDHKSKIATIYLNKIWVADKETEEKQIEKIAFHEIMELLLSKLMDYSGAEHPISFDNVTEQIHSIINVFQKIFFPEE